MVSSGVDYVPYFLSEFFIIFMFVRFYAVFRHFERYHEFSDLNSQKILRKFGNDGGRMFTFKCEINHERKAMAVTFLFVFSVMVLAFIMRIFELPYEHNSKIKSSAMIDFGSAIWLAVITMTTVGYGDICPKTVGGQITAMIIALWGAFVISLLIMITANIFDFNPSE